MSANEKLGVAVIGANGRGGSHIDEYLRDERTEIRAIVDADEAVANRRCDDIEKKQGTRPKAVIDMRQAFDDKSIDFISTATPNHWHALTGVWAMQAGKDAYIEKPVCHNVHEGSALIAAARKYGRMCQVGTQCRSSQAIIDAFAFMREGGIGEVNFARGLCYKRRKSIGAKGDYAIPASVNFDLWSGPASLTDPKCTRERFHYDWHWQRHYGNGDLGNQGPHQTDVARWGLGIDTHPSTILTYGGRLGYQAERKDPDYVDAGDTGNTEVSIYDYGTKCIVFETRGLSVDDSDDDELNTLFRSTKGQQDRRRVLRVRRLSRPGSVQPLLGIRQGHESDSRIQGWRRSLPEFRVGRDSHAKWKTSMRTFAKDTCRPQSVISAISRTTWAKRIACRSQRFRRISRASRGSTTIRRRWIAPSNIWKRTESIWTSTGCRSARFWNSIPRRNSSRTTTPQTHC